MWTLQNLGVGNKSLIEAAGSRLRSADLEILVTLDRVRSEVASAQARTHARFAQVLSCELAIQSGIPAFREDIERIRGGEGLPLEVVDSLRLLARARERYVNTIIDYNRAQFQLYVALGKPPAELLLRPASEIDMVLPPAPKPSRAPLPNSPTIMRGSSKSIGPILIAVLLAGALLGGATAFAGPRGRKPAGSARPVPRISRAPIVQTSANDAVSDTEPSRSRPELLHDEEAEALKGLERASVLPAAAKELLIDLPTALQLAETENPSIALGRQAIVEAVALQTGARGMLLPTLNAGTNYHLHQGVLQTSFGLIRNLNEQSLYVGGGARTLAAETVAIPAVRIFSHLGDALFAPLAAGQVVCSRSADSLAIENATLLSVVELYLDLAIAESSLDAIHQGEDNMRVVVLATAAFAKAGQGREGDFNRARTEALLLHAEEQSLQEDVAVASAHLSRVLHLDPSIRLRTQPGALEMVQLIDPNSQLEDLVQLALSARPELEPRAPTSPPLNIACGRKRRGLCFLVVSSSWVQRWGLRRRQQPPGPRGARLLADLRWAHRFRRDRRLVSPEHGFWKHGSPEAQPRRSRAGRCRPRTDGQPHRPRSGGCLGRRGNEKTPGCLCPAAALDIGHRGRARRARNARGRAKGCRSKRSTASTCWENRAGRWSRPSAVMTSPNSSCLSPSDKRRTPRSPTPPAATARSNARRSLRRPLAHTTRRIVTS